MKYFNLALLVGAAVVCKEAGLQTEAMTCWAAAVIVVTIIFNKP